MRDHASGVGRRAVELAGHFAGGAVRPGGLLLPRQDQAIAQKKEPVGQRGQKQDEKQQRIQLRRLTGQIAHAERPRRELHVHLQRFVILERLDGLRGHGVLRHIDLQIIVDDVLIIAARPLRRSGDRRRERHTQRHAANRVFPAGLRRIEPEALAGGGFRHAAWQRVCTGKALLAGEARRIGEGEAGRAVHRRFFVSPAGKNDVLRPGAERDLKLLHRRGEFHLRRHRDLRGAVLADRDVGIQGGDLRVRGPRCARKGKQAKKQNQNSPHGDHLPIIKVIHTIAQFRANFNLLLRFFLKKAKIRPERGRIVFSCGAWGTMV